MILDYPKIKENELYFAYILRYHRYLGGSSLGQTFRYFMQKQYRPVSVIFPAGIEKSLAEIRMSPDMYVNAHSVLPYYRIFFREADYRNVVPETVVGSFPHTRRILNNQGKGTGEKQESLWYCPVCHAKRRDYDDIRIYHQIPEVHVCPEHHCYLKQISVRESKVLAEPESWDIGVEMCEDVWLNGIAEDVRYIMEKKPEIFADAFCDAYWSWFEECADAVPFKSWNGWEAWINGEVNGLPEIYRTEFEDFRFRDYLHKENTAKFKRIEYLVLIRMMYGSFEGFVGKLRQDGVL